MANQGKNWTPLDNVAKIFPSSCQKSDTRVFRFSCELVENVDPEFLQKALDEAIIEYPHFLSIMRRGAFWYYLEASDIKPMVRQEDTCPCPQLYFEGKQSLLFSLTYYKKRINLDVFHVLSDGTGALQFLKAIINLYLIKKYTDDFKEHVPIIQDTTSAPEKAADSFDTYYQDNVQKFSKPYKARVKAFKPKYERRDDDDLLFIEALINTNKVRELAKKYNTTVTIFLVSVYMISISQEMKVRNRKNPVIIGIPVNLRKYFYSSTVRNFFAVDFVDYNFTDSDLWTTNNDGLLQKVIEKVTKCFSSSLEPEQIKKNISSLCELEHRFFVRIAPLFLKDFILRLSCNESEKYTTSIVSNIGVISMPSEFSKYIHHFSFFTSTLTFELNVCSYNDILVLGYSVAYKNTEIIRNMLRLFTLMGVEVEVRSNGFSSNEMQETVTKAEQKKTFLAAKKQEKVSQKAEKIAQRKAIKQAKIDAKAAKKQEKVSKKAEKIAQRKAIKQAKIDAKAAKKQEKVSQKAEKIAQRKAIKQARIDAKATKKAEKKLKIKEKIAQKKITRESKTKTINSTTIDNKTIK